MYCHQCGGELPEGARFCPSCGTSLTGAPAPAAPTGVGAGPSATSMRGFVLLVCIGFGIVLLIGSGFAEMEIGEEGRQFLAVTIYNFVLGASFITAAILFMIQHRRAPHLAAMTAFVYIVCTVVNEIVQLAHGQYMFSRHIPMTAVRAAWDILFWSFFPVFVLILSILIIRMEAELAAGPKEGSQ